MTDYIFAKRSQNVPNSGIAFMMRYAAKYQDVISLGQGAPQFRTPQFIYDAVWEQIKTDPEAGMYADPRNENTLKDLLAKEFKELYGFTPRREELLTTIGGVGGLYAAFMALIDRGDEVIFFDPSYPLHLEQIHLAEGNPVFVSYDEEAGWALDCNKVESVITEKTRAIVLTNPNNPTGTVLTKAQVQQLADIVAKHKLILILDEAYQYLSFDKKLFSPMEIPELRDRVVLCKSFSKEYAMTGWRIGYVYASEELINHIREVHISSAVTVPNLSLIAAIAALSDPRGKEAMVEFKEEISRSRDAICQRMDNLPKLFSYQKPEGAFYLFPKILYPDVSALDFGKMLIDECQVITVPGDSMGPAGKGHLRISFSAPPDVINRAFDRIDTFAKKLD